MEELKVINYYYKSRRSWNCSKVCSKAEFAQWLQHDTRMKHKIVFIENGYNCYIDD